MNATLLTASFLLTVPVDPPEPVAELPGLEYVDQGKFDPALNGYEVPSGIRLEVVEDVPYLPRGDVTFAGRRYRITPDETIIRFQSDPSRSEVFATGLSGSFPRLTFDGVGNLFAVAGDREQTWLYHIPEGSRKPRPIHQLTGLKPTSLSYFEESQLPLMYRGVLYADFSKRRVRAMALEPRGATFKVSHQFTLLQSDDPKFEPINVRVGPDGAIQIRDSRERTYRLRWTGGTVGPFAEEVPEIPLREKSCLQKLSDPETTDDAKLISYLDSEDWTVRRTAGQELVQRGERTRPALLKLVQDREEAETHARIEAVIALNQLWNDDVRDAFVNLLRDPDRDIRRLVVEGLTEGVQPGDGLTLEKLIQAMGDEDGAVRRAVAKAIARIGKAKTAWVLVNSVLYDAGEDAVLSEGFIRALELTGDAGMNELLQALDSGSAEDRNGVVKALLRVRHPAGIHAIQKALYNPHLDPTQKASLIRSLGEFDPDTRRVAGKPQTLLEYLAGKNRSPAEQQAALKILQGW